jgi:small subunit ribosomal protein S18
MSSFVTEMGKLKGRPNTNLTRKSQRRLAKAVRRAKMMGLMPVLSRMPAITSLTDKVSGRYILCAETVD